MDKKVIRRVFIYSLSDPDTGEIKYIGMCADLEKRMTGHLSCTEKSDKTIWIKGLFVNGKKPVMTKIEECDWYYGRERESFYMVKAIQDGNKLYNKVGAHYLMTTGFNFDINLKFRSLIYKISHETGKNQSQVMNEILSQYFDKPITNQVPYDQLHNYRLQENGTYTK